MSRAATLAAMLALAGCAGLGDGSSDEAVPPPPTMPSSAAPEPLPSIAVPPREDGVLGRTAAQVQALLGPPDQVRRDQGVQVMQYARAACVLDIVLYEPAPGTHFRARHLESRTPEGARLPPVRCLAELIPLERWPRLEPE